MSIRRLTAVLIVFGVGVCSILLYPIVMLDGPSGVIFPLLTWPDTEYSSGFSHRSFLSVRSGMTSAEIRQLLGEPLNIYRVPETGETGWSYSETPTNSSYRVRAVLFRQGRVTRRLSEFYVD